MATINFTSPRYCSSWLVQTWYAALISLTVSISAGLSVSRKYTTTAGGLSPSFTPVFLGPIAWNYYNKHKIFGHLKRGERSIITDLTHMAVRSLSHTPFPVRGYTVSSISLPLRPGLLLSMVQQTANGCHSLSSREGMAGEKWTTTEQCIVIPTARVEFTD